MAAQIQPCSSFMPVYLCQYGHCDLLQTQADIVQESRSRLGSRKRQSRGKHTRDQRVLDGLKKHADLAGDAELIFLSLIGLDCTMLYKQQIIHSILETVAPRIFDTNGVVFAKRNQTSFYFEYGRLFDPRKDDIREWQNGFYANDFGDMKIPLLDGLLATGTPTLVNLTYDKSRNTPQEVVQKWKDQISEAGSTHKYAHLFAVDGDEVMRLLVPPPHAFWKMSGLYSNLYVSSIKNGTARNQFYTTQEVPGIAWKMMQTTFWNNAAYNDFNKAMPQFIKMYYLLLTIITQRILALQKHDHELVEESLDHLCQICFQVAFLKKMCDEFQNKFPSSACLQNIKERSQFLYDILVYLYECWLDTMKGNIRYPSEWKGAFQIKNVFKFTDADKGMYIKPDWLQHQYGVNDVYFVRALQVDTNQIGGCMISRTDFVMPLDCTPSEDFATVSFPNGSSIQFDGENFFNLTQWNSYNNRRRGNILTDQQFQNICRQVVSKAYELTEENQILTWFVSEINRIQTHKLTEAMGFTSSHCLLSKLPIVP